MSVGGVTTQTAQSTRSVRQVPRVDAALAAVPGGQRADAAGGEAVDALAARICSGIAAAIGFEGFLRLFATPEDCPSHLAPAAVEVDAACAAARDRDACVDERVRVVVGEYVDGQAGTGAVYTTAGGARVRVMSLEDAGVTDVERLGWAEFLDRLPHGSELESLTLRLGTPLAVRTACGAPALACYLPSAQTIVAGPSDQEHAPHARALITHEYGHHLANTRLNPPWSALDRGTKRWSTHMRICERVRSRELRARALWGPGYRLLPSEGFAEAYRVLAERRLAVAPAPWLLVDERFYPDAEALRLLEQDVRDPWVAPTRLSLTGSGSHAFKIGTPLDGAVHASITSAPGSAYRVSAPATVCGQRRIVVRVQHVRGNAPFRLTVTRP